MLITDWGNFPILNTSSTADINLALVIYKSLLRSILSYASPIWGYAAKIYKNKLQTFQAKVLKDNNRITEGNTNCNLTWRGGMPLIKSHIKKLARALYGKSATSENSQIQELGHYDSISDQHLRPLSLLAGESAQYCNLK
jgi:hypothetical protein